MSFPQRRIATSRSQRGAALIVLMAIIVLGASGYFLSALNAASSNVDNTRRQISSKALAEAKQALLGYVATLAYTDANPGRLPCPEAPVYVGTINEGLSQNDREIDNANPRGGFCGAGTVVGRLPWRTLGVPKLTDGYGEPLWYVVSPGFALPALAGPLSINSNTSAQIVVDGTITAVALIIAPGSPMNVQMAPGCTARVQTRAAIPGIPPDLRDYLECENATLPSDALFVSSGPATSYNDQVLKITHAELFNSVEPVVAKRIETQIVPELVKSYYAGPLLPWKDATTSTPATETSPVFPYAVQWGNLAAVPTSRLEGSSSPKTYQGLLPLFSHASDPEFVYWDPPQGVSANQTGGTGSVSSSTCSGSNAAALTCSITYTGAPIVAVRGYARNVLNTFGRLDLSGVTGFAAATPNVTEASIFANAQVRMEFSGNLPGVGATGGTALIRVPIAMFADHQLLDGSNATYGWFGANRWHQLIYYAVAAENSPNGSTFSCTDVQGSATSCLRLTPGDAAGSGKQRAILILAGRSLSGLPRPNATLADFVEVENANGDTVFTKLPASRTFNDRIVVLSARP